MASPKKPQDHLSKKTTDEIGPEYPFAFEHDGEDFELPAPAPIMTGGFVRKNRHLSTQNQFWLLIETLADEKTLAAIDDMDAHELGEFQKDFYAHLKVPLGES